MLLIAYFAVLVLLSVRTIIRNFDWKDWTTLFVHDRKISTVSYELENELAYYYLTSSQTDKAKTHIDNSIRLAPIWWENWNNLGAYYEAKGNINEAFDAFQEAVNNNSNYYHGNISLAYMHFKYKTPEEASDNISKAINKYPKEPFLWYLKGVVSYRMDKKDEALAEMMSAYNLSKDNYYLKVYQLMLKGEKIE